MKKTQQYTSIFKNWSIEAIKTEDSKSFFFYSLIPSSYSCPNIFDFKTLLFSL